MLRFVLFQLRPGVTVEIPGRSKLAENSRRPQIYRYGIGETSPTRERSLPDNRISMHSSSGHKVDSAPNNAGNSPHETRRRVAFSAQVARARVGVTHRSPEA